MKPTKALERVSGAYMAALVTHPSFPVLRAYQIGCLFAWARLALAPRSVRRHPAPGYSLLNAQVLF